MGKNNANNGSDMKNPEENTAKTNSKAKNQKNSGKKILKNPEKESGIELLRKEINEKNNKKERAISGPKSGISQKTVMIVGIIAFFAIIGTVYFFSIKMPAGNGNSDDYSDVAPSEIKTYTKHDMRICTDNEKPIVMMYSLTNCPHCDWVKDAFKAAVKPYVDEGLINAYIWELDTGDDSLTTGVETELPKKFTQLYNYFDTTQQVPFFVVGCRYYRLGTAYEIENDKIAEVAELKAVIEQMLKEYEIQKNPPKETDDQNK